LIIYAICANGPWKVGGTSPYGEMLAWTFEPHYILAVCSRANVERYALGKSEGVDMKKNLMMPSGLMIQV
jgi:hypothetical protein